MQKINDLTLKFSTRNLGKITSDTNFLTLGGKHNLPLRVKMVGLLVNVQNLQHFAIVLLRHH